MTNETAIRFDAVSKSYRLGSATRDQLRDALGLSRFFGRPRRDTPEFQALKDVSFEVPRGRRYGLIGRNGAGKTTLLKLISGNFAPTSGTVEVNGSVQALLTMGHGFHPDYTGRDNIESSLQYNGLSRAEFREAMDDVIEFCELGQFIDQPFKTYSSGMQARLMFATATAVRPDILVVDEVLGAGDAYFIAKSKRRVDKLVNSGCTLLLVSHSMQQVLELCDQVVWLDRGRIRMFGDAFRVVKAYEEWMYGSITRLDGSDEPAREGIPGDPEPRPERPAAHAETAPSAPAAPRVDAVAATQTAMDLRGARRFALQTPAFMPHASPAELPEVPDAEGRVLRHEAPGGFSRWQGDPGLKIVGVSISGPNGPTDRLVSLQPASVTLFLEVEADGRYACTYGIAIHDLQGRAVTRIFGPPDRFEARRGEGRRIEILLNPNQIGPGSYTLGVSILEETTIEQVNFARRFDLLSRSFLFHVDLPDTLGAIGADYFHSAEWTFAPARLGEAGEGQGDGGQEAQDAAPAEEPARAAAAQG